MSVLRPLPPSIDIVEVGPRDGFQMERKFIPTELKVASIEALAEAGLRTIEAASFVHPRVVPQMRDASDVLAQIRREGEVRYTALVPNLRGAERALEAGVDELHLVICVTETYNQHNVGMSCAESLEALEQIVRLARSTERVVPVAVTMASTFGCPYEGQLPDEELIAFAHRVANAGAALLGLADTIGQGEPELVARVVEKVQVALPLMPLRMHLHDTRGFGIANAIAALECGVVQFDTAFGGMGGCPVIEGATGNIATEAFADACTARGVTTGVDVEAVARVAAQMRTFLSAKELSP